MIVISNENKPNSCRKCIYNFNDLYCRLSHGSIDRDDYTCDKPCTIKELPEDFFEMLTLKLDCLEAFVDEAQNVSTKSFEQSRLLQDISERVFDIKKYITN